jgi:excisionase family DNA binding protein
VEQSNRLTAGEGGCIRGRFFFCPLKRKKAGMIELNEDASGVLAGYLSSRELAQQLHKHPRTIRRYAVEQGLPSVVLGKTRYFRREAVSEWLRQLEHGLRRPARRRAVR